MIFPYESGTRNNRERGKEKLIIVLLWIAEFDFSTIELLSWLLRQYPEQTNLFFRKLIAQHYLVPFESDTFVRKDLVRIGSAGVAYLKENFGIDVRRKMRSDELARKRKLYHDYCLQLYIADTYMYRDSYSVITEKKIFRARGKATRIPDALVFNLPNKHTMWNVSQETTLPDEVEEARRGVEFFDDQGFWFNENAPIAIEIELEGKSQSKVEAIFKSLLFQIRAGKLQQVRFIFAKQSLCKKYREWFAEFKMKHFELPAVSRYRDCFSFEVDYFFPYRLLEREEREPEIWTS